MSATRDEQNERTAKNRRRWRLLFAGLCAAGLASGGWAWWTDRRYRSAMEEIESDILGHRYALACGKLQELLSWKADRNGGIAYLLGSCELARGRVKSADEAWLRVAPGSKFSEKAIRGRMRLLRESGQLAAAEQVVIDAAGDPRNDRTAVLVSLVPMYQELGRIDEAARLIEDRWEQLNALGQGALELSLKLLRQHIDLTTVPTPVDAARNTLDRAYRQAPDDDRVWLGRANLAIRTGAFQEAERWIEACERKRPDDTSVWSTRLSWGMAVNRTDVVYAAARKLPASELTTAQVGRLNAWLAARRGDIASQRRALERVHLDDPADETALERLAELANKDGQPARAVEYTRQKAEIDQLSARYKQLHERVQPIRDAVRMARLAEQLGRRFEAIVFLTVAISEEPTRADLRGLLSRLRRGRTSAGKPGEKVVDLVSDGHLDARSAQ
jgi:tetratricopeptide (TPR) repeat protein